MMHRYNIGNIIDLTSLSDELERILVVYITYRYIGVLIKKIE